MENSKPKEPTKEEILKHWKDTVKEIEKSFGKTHDIKEFTFSFSERKQLVELYTIETLAARLINEKINTDVLGRLGVTPNSDTFIDYDLALGRFVLRTPKEKKA